jgi:hypothetical protein
VRIGQSRRGREGGFVGVEVIELIFQNLSLLLSAGGWGDGILYFLYFLYFLVTEAFTRVDCRDDRAHDDSVV